MNKPIRTMAIFCMLLFLGLMANATYLQYIQADELSESQYNRRVIVESFSRERGAILVGRDPVAESRPSDDEYKFQRTYPQPLRYAHVTGWFSYFSQAGVERTQNDVLSGEDDRLFVTRLLDMVSNSSPQGGSVELTLSQAAQVAAYDGLAALGENVQGAVVALEPSTGKVLAMVSSPSFDPNRLASHDLGAVQDVDQELNTREDEPKLNRAISTTLPPGSTFKLVTAAAAIETGNYDADALVPGGPTYQLPQSTVKIGNGGRSCGTDRIPMIQALEQSCNTTFLALAEELGNEKMTEQAEKFGFNATSLEDLAGQAPSKYPEGANEPNTALTGIGQFDVTATPLQMAMVVSAIANDGDLMRPYLVDEVRSPDLDTLDKTEPERIREAMSSSTAFELKKMLVSVVANGTGTPAAIPGVDVGGKTGTAESGSDQRTNYAWFVSLAPADDPQVAVAVMIQNAGVPNDDIAGGRLAGPIAKSVMEAVIDQ
ncbi:peptidoglycan D,D-transpeptidase FtsI family protein [Nocardioides donggukensis]|uniref:Penicillin-binding protein 2 n=1 Tax=Nocardioides donggukensis TaxID=2774019 RepID=A0A927K1G1_9ACTN|nr:penicillin-binding protein 2 [Nocardioides donggukensis]MBD8868009.1 penicillin-binding protein 2 [Nocardioides donggukensis]